MDLLPTGDPIDAERALDLVNAVVAPGELRDRCSSSQTRSHRRRRSPSQPSDTRYTREVDVPIHDALDAERIEVARVINTEDAREGVSAFLKKRPPTWQGR